MKILSQSFNQDSKIRILLIDGKEYSVAKDIATLLGYKRSADAILNIVKNLYLSVI
jgi:prophage antirepressor-like protein